MRLPSNVASWLSAYYPIYILRIFACETQDFASLLSWFATGKYGFSQIIAVASACRDARFCVSRAMWRAGCQCVTPFVYCASLLVRRKILRLYFVVLRRENMFFSQIIAVASACRDAKSCVSRAMWQATSQCVIRTVKNIDNVLLTGSLFSVAGWSVLKNACFRAFVYIVECQRIMFFATRCELFRFVKEAFLYAGKGSLAV